MARFSRGGAQALSVAGVLAAWLVHLYTASGAVLALLATLAVFEYRFRDAFFWLAVQVVVDATDGTLARRFDVSRVLPGFRGALLDDIVDYLTYVFVPALIVWRSILVPGDWVLVVCSAMLLSSAYGFSRADAKTSDHFFTGFPSYWNIVVFYLLLGGGSPRLNAGVLLVLAVLVFVPVKYLYPNRTPHLRRTTLALGIAWAASMALMLWWMPLVPRGWYWASLLFPVYYVVVSLLLHVGWLRPPGPARHVL